MTESPRARRAAPGVLSGSPARRCRGFPCAPSPLSSFCDSPEVSHRPSLLMAMGTTSYLLRSIALSTDAAESDLRAFLRERIAKFKVPARFVVVPALPRTAAGKVDRARLQEG